MDVRSNRTGSTDLCCTCVHTVYVQTPPSGGAFLCLLEHAIKFTNFVSRNKHLWTWSTSQSISAGRDCYRLIGIKTTYRRSDYVFEPFRSGSNPLSSTIFT